MRYELIEAATRVRATEFEAPDPQLNIFDEIHPGQSAEEVADALLRAAAEMEIAETRCW
jgi:hypothetical protein